MKQLSAELHRAPSAMPTFVDRVIAGRRTLPQALADIRAKYEDTGDADLAEMIRHAEAEIIEREDKSLAEASR